MPVDHCIGNAGRILRKCPLTNKVEDTIERGLMHILANCQTGFKNRCERKSQDKHLQLFCRFYCGCNIISEKGNLQKFKKIIPAIAMTAGEENCEKKIESWNQE